MAKSLTAEQAKVVEALRSLRKAIASTSAPFPDGIAYIRDTREFPQVAAVKAAAAAVRAVWPNPDQGTLEDSPPLIAPRRVLQDIGRFLRDDVGQLDRLPASLSILRKLDALIEDVGGKTPPAQSDGPWSKADGPQQWAKKFGFSTDTLMRRFKDGTIRHKELSSKSYRIHVDDVPK